MRRDDGGGDSPDDSDGGVSDRMDPDVPGSFSFALLQGAANEEVWDFSGDIDEEDTSSEPEHNVTIVHDTSIVTSRSDESSPMPHNVEDALLIQRLQSIERKRLFDEGDAAEEQAQNERGTRVAIMVRHKTTHQLQLNSQSVVKKGFYLAGLRTWCHRRQSAVLLIAIFALMVLVVALPVGISLSNRDDSNTGNNIVVSSQPTNPPAAFSQSPSFPLIVVPAVPTRPPASAPVAFPQYPSSPSPILAAFTQSPSLPSLTPLAPTTAPQPIISWEQKGQDLGSNGTIDRFGTSVALAANGRTVAVGSYLGVQVFGYNLGTRQWIQQGSELEGDAAGDRFGTSVAMSADGAIVAVGANLKNANGFTSSGQVRVFVYDHMFGLWYRKGGDLDGEAAFDQFGKAIALSADGSILAVGAINSDESGQNAGQVKVFRLSSDEDQWIQMGQTLTGDAAGDQFGTSVALSADGTIIAIGAPWNDGDGPNSGQVLVFRYGSRPKNKWTRIGQALHGRATRVIAGRIGVPDGFGRSVDLSADGYTVVAGANHDNANGNESGQVRVFRYISKSQQWEQIGQDLNGESEGDWLGTAVGISADGNVVAVGAIFNCGNGSKAGSVRVFRFVASLSQWIQIGVDLDGEDADDHFGDPISLSADGATLAIGSSFNGENAVQSGHVRVFRGIPAEV